MNSTLEAVVVDKEVVGNLRFPAQEVLTAPELIKQRQESLHKALSLGNLSKFKVKIIFEDVEGKKMVNTTVWAITENNLVLKAGRTIPLHRVHKIHFI